MSRSLVLSFVLGVLSLVLAAPRAQACSCIKERSELAQRLSQADLVVFGTITELRTERGFHHLTVQIAHALLGAATGERIEIVTGTDDGTCGVEVAVGESYLFWPGYSSWPTFDAPKRSIDTCSGQYRRMTPDEFATQRSELEAAVADSLNEAGVGDAGGTVMTAPPQAASAASTSEADSEGCALSGGRHDSSAVLLWLTALGIARSRSRRRRSPAPAP